MCWRTRLDLQRRPETESKTAVASCSIFSAATLHYDALCREVGAVEASVNYRAPRPEAPLPRHLRVYDDGVAVLRYLDDVITHRDIKSSKAPTVQHPRRHLLDRQCLRVRPLAALTSPATTTPMVARRDMLDT
ncbi:hypothetical protein ABZP36_032286 [Zizania latifolia]